MARGSNTFRRNDVIRLVRAAQDAGIDPGGLEVVVGGDNTVILRILALKAMTGKAPTRRQMTRIEVEPATPAKPR
jgi:hypothetical protein